MHATDNRYRVVHVVPYDGIGGVETAVRSMSKATYGPIKFTRFYLTGAVTSGHEVNAFSANAKSLSSPFEWIKCAWIIRKMRPDLIIASLWRGVAVSIVVKIIRPKTNLVVFLHFPKHVHLLDLLINRVGMWLSAEIWADSKATLHKRIPESYRRKGYTISFLVERLKEIKSSKSTHVFAFWGRLHPQKRLDRAIDIFAAIAARFPDSQFIIIGPDGGHRSHLEYIVRQRGLEDRVAFLGALTLPEIQKAAERASFFLQTSVLEGMSISVVEAMQMGLVPIVTPVGEIGEYTADGVNSIHVSDQKEDIVQHICDIISDTLEYSKLRNAALETWSSTRLYHEDVVARCMLFAANVPRDHGSNGHQPA